MNNSKCMVQGIRGEQGNLLTSIPRPRQQRNPKENAPGLSARQTTHRSAPQTRVSIQHNSLWSTSCHAMAPADFSLGITRGWCCSPSPCGSLSTGPSSWDGRVLGHSESRCCRLGFLCFTKICVWPMLPILAKILHPVALDEEQGKVDGIEFIFSKTFSPRTLINKSDFAKYLQENEKQWCFSNWTKLYITWSIMYWTS